MEWLRYVLDWSWSLLRAYGIDFTLVLFYDDLAKVFLGISCAFFQVH